MEAAWAGPGALDLKPSRCCSHTNAECTWLVSGLLFSVRGLHLRACSDGDPETKGSAAKAFPSCTPPLLSLQTTHNVPFLNPHEHRVPNRTPAPRTPPAHIPQRRHKGRENIKKSISEETGSHCAQAKPLITPSLRATPLNPEWIELGIKYKERGKSVKLDLLGLTDSKGTNT